MSNLKMPNMLHPSPSEMEWRLFRATEFAYWAKTLENTPMLDSLRQNVEAVAVNLITGTHWNIIGTDLMVMASECYKRHNLWLVEYGFSAVKIVGEWGAYKHARAHFDAKLKLTGSAIGIPLYYILADNVKRAYWQHRKS